MPSRINQQKASGTAGRFGHLRTGESQVDLGTPASSPAPQYQPARRGRGEQDQTNRWRCTVADCNPVLIGEDVANQHVDETGHRIAKWPIRSKAGKAKAKNRNRNGYYDKYNVGDKAIRPGTADGHSTLNMSGTGRRDWHSNEDYDHHHDFDYDVHPFSDEAFG